MALIAPRFLRCTRLQVASSNGPPVKRDETGAGVKDLQRALLDLRHEMPISTGDGLRPPDGIFGPETERVLKKFQGAQGLVVDGIAGPRTLRRMDEIFARKDPFYENAAVAQARLTGQMAGPSPPFSATTNRSRGGES